jgi:hypothetical protein
MTPRQHLIEFHQSSETHHRGCAKCHLALSALHKAMADATAQGDEKADLHLEASQAHRDLADSHVAQAEFHADSCGSLKNHGQQKAEVDADLEKIFG